MNDIVAIEHDEAPRSAVAIRAQVNLILEGDRLRHCLRVQQARYDRAHGAWLDAVRDAHAFKAERDAACVRIESIRRRLGGVSHVQSNRDYPFPF